MSPQKSKNQKELLLAALRHEKTEGIPWVPFAGIHVGKLKGYPAREILTDKNKLVESLLEANRLYQPDGQPVLFDLQIEAEILGCDLLWADDAPPSVASHPLSKTLAIPEHLPQKNEGRLPLVLDAMLEMKEQVGEHTALYGLVTGPFTLASHLRGTEIFMDTFDNPDFLISLLEYATKVCKKISSYYIETGMDIIGIVDPVISQISPRMFKKFLHEPFSELFSYLKDEGVYSAFFVCGDATKNIEPMCKTGPDSIAVDENINLPEVKKITDAYNVTIQGNIPLTTCMLLGTQQDNMKYVVDLLDQVDTHNLIVSPGCDMPYDIPIENVIGTAEAIRDKERARQLLSAYKVREINLENVQVPDYQNLQKPLIEVFTLDSATCPACGYMKLAAERAFQELEGQVDMVEYKATNPENIARMQKMEIKNLPSIMINGELKFSSIIPSNRELVETIRGYIKG